MKNVVEVYCIVFEIVKIIKEKTKELKKGRPSKLNEVDLITILLIGHYHEIQTTKKLYDFIQTYMQSDFNELPCYEQFTRGLRSVSHYLDLVLTMIGNYNKEKNNDFYIIDSTPLPVSKFDSYTCPKWASDAAKKGKNIFGYYFGFKLHLIINQSMEVVSYTITSANMHDVKSLSLSDFITTIQGKLIGDKGYICSEAVKNNLKQNNIELIFKKRNNIYFLNDKLLKVFLAI